MARKRILHNGIELPAEWPPRRKLTHAPQPVPYLTHRPRTACIDVGRQLLVDDFLIQRTTLRRTFHRAAYHPDCPVLADTKPWECRGGMFFAAPFSDGVWFDSADGKFKMWYLGAADCTCYAESADGIAWRKPTLDVVPGTNIVLREPRDSSTIWLDHEDPNPRRKFKMLCLGIRKRRWSLILRFSADGIHWSRPAAAVPSYGDRTTFYRDPFRGVWVYSLRWFTPWNSMTPIKLSKTLGRIRAYREHRDIVAGLKDCDRLAVPWLGADNRDLHHPNPKYAHIVPQLYNFDAAPYESLMLGQYSIWLGPENDESHRVGNHKRCEVLLGFSRDGFHFSRPDRRAFMGVNETPRAWNWGNVQSAAGGPVVVGDDLYFYVSGRALPKKPTTAFGQGNMSTGLAVLRRDGFASMDSPGKPGTLTTRPLRFAGKCLFVNAKISGRLEVEVLDLRGKVIAPFSRANCLGVRGDRTKAEVNWKGVADLSAVSGRRVRFRFRLAGGSLFAFWVSRDASGVSNGHIAGGPAFAGSRG